MGKRFFHAGLWLQPSKAMLALCGSLTMACGAIDPSSASGEDISAKEQPVAGGELDTTHTSAVALRIDYNGSHWLCSGSLFLPNLVLTAHHCVAPTKDPLICGQDGFQNPYPASAIRVTQAPDLFAKDVKYVPVSEVHLPDSPNQCGADFALLILQGSGFGSSVGDLLVPRIDAPTKMSESYSVIGYGQTNGTDPYSAGRRRMRDGLQVGCGPGACTDLLVGKNEWIGGAGPCSGDSGGPALDAKSRVIGALSRSDQDCNGAIFESVAGWKDWMMSVAKLAAKSGDFAAPYWAISGSSAEPPDAGNDAALNDGAADAAGSGTTHASTDDPNDASGCSLAAVGRPVSGTLGVLVAAFALLIRRRRERSATMIGCDVR